MKDLNKLKLENLTVTSIKVNGVEYDNAMKAIVATEFISDNEGVDISISAFMYSDDGVYNVFAKNGEVYTIIKSVCGDCKVSITHWYDMKPDNLLFDISMYDIRERRKKEGK